MRGCRKALRVSFCVTNWQFVTQKLLRELFWKSLIIVVFSRQQTFLSVSDMHFCRFFS